jgi:ABC-type nickel/cobalt efflux system permease component RcnA
MPLAAESWIAVLFGGMIPIAGALAVLYIIVRAVRDNDEDSDPE